LNDRSSERLRTPECAFKEAFQSRTSDPSIRTYSSIHSNDSNRPTANLKNEPRLGSSFGTRDVRSAGDTWGYPSITPAVTYVCQGITRPARNEMSSSVSSPSLSTIKERRASTSPSTPSQSDNREPDEMEHEPLALHGSSEKDKRHTGASRWLRNVKDWISISEPSAKAMKDEKLKMQKRRGLGPRESQLVPSFHYPGGQIPSGAITSTAGPRPEKALRSSTRDSELRKSYLTTSPTSHSVSSLGSWPSSVKDGNRVAPWEK
jgi:hypothetical protein